MAEGRVQHPSVAEREAAGKRARDKSAPNSHAGWNPAADRPDPVALLEEQNATREPDLVPVRHGRMMVSPFTFYRGAAKIMAADLKDTPSAGLNVQLCGDAHLSNFGVFASPERTLLFDLNDFDETLPGPFEYDVKRMAASFTIAARNNGFSKAETQGGHARLGPRLPRGDGRVRADGHDGHLVRAPVRGGADGGDQEAAGADGKASKAQEEGGEEGREASRRRRRRRPARATACRRCRSSASSSTAGTGSSAQPPIVIPPRDLAAMYGDVRRGAPARRPRTVPRLSVHAAERSPPAAGAFEVVDIARKVVGVGSVGTRAFIGLLQGSDEQDPLFLQVKEATASVLEDHLPKSRYKQPGERVVQGQRMMQAASDIFLGWTKGVQANRYLYWRQLRDMKGSADVESMAPASLTVYARAFGWTLARAHARSGDPVAIAAYLGKSDAFDRSITDFAERYADQNDATTRRSSMRSARAGWRPSRASDHAMSDAGWIVDGRRRW